MFKAQRRSLNIINEKLLKMFLLNTQPGLSARAVSILSKWAGLQIHESIELRWTTAASNSFALEKEKKEKGEKVKL
jgi:hypothetical protein